MTAPVTTGPAPAGIAARIRFIVGGSIGNLVEWYDWYTYPAFALYFSKSFFPQGDQTAQLLNAAAIYAIGFLIRPLGSWLMGIYADRKGRRPALIVSMLIMGFGSLGVAVIPSYETIGFLAPILLVACRLVQGLSLGGQYAASATYVSEMSLRAHRGFWSSILFVTLLMGLLLSMLVLLVLQATLSAAELTAWGWRIPFVIGAVLALVALAIILKLEETRSFEAVNTSAASAQTWPMMRAHWRELWIVFIITAAGTTAYQNYTTYMPKFLVNTSGLTPEAAARVSTLSIILFMCMHPVMGWLSDKVGRKPLLIAFSVLGTLFTVPLMSGLAHAGDPVTALIILVTALAFLCPYTATSPLFKAELFPTEIRALGVGLPFALANALFAGAAEFTALSFKRAGHEDYYFWYLTALMAVGLITAVRMRDPALTSRIQED